MSRLKTNPWFAILFRPRVAIRDVVSYDPRYRFVPLSAIYGFPMCLQLSEGLGLGDQYPIYWIIVFSAILAIPVGALALTIFAGLLSWTGGWIDGKADFMKIRAAVSWSNVPALADTFIWILLMCAFGDMVFTKNFFSTPFEGGERVFIMSMFFIQLIVAVWSFILFLITLSEVQKFSIWKAIINLIIPIAIFGGGLVILNWAVRLAIA
jgi:hypothetical protein